MFSAEGVCKGFRVVVSVMSGRSSQISTYGLDSPDTHHPTGTGSDQAVHWATTASDWTTRI